MLNSVSIMKNKIAIHVFSTTNEWLDCVFIVNENDAVRAEYVLSEALDDWLKPVPDAENECYGDWLCRKMDEADFEYDVFYHSWEENDDAKIYQ